MDEVDLINDLRKQKELCMAECASISKKLADLEEGGQKSEIAKISLSSDKKLIDLLIHRILDPNPDWKSKIDTLIRIPNSMKGQDLLRGGSYFEALFQLAIAIGEMPQFKKVTQFYDIKGYKTKTKIDNYLYTKTIKNAGGGETGIADIMFEIDIGEGGQSVSYSCGEILYPQPDIGNPYYFISVKGFNREKSISQSYDIPLLDQQLNVFPELKNRHIVVCVRNKEQFMTRLGRTKQNFLKNSIDHVIGYDEVMDIFDAFRTRFFVSLGNTTIEERVKELFPETGIMKPGLSLYFHQELVVESVVQRLHDLGDKEDPHFMCIGVLPRGGKSYIAGGIINSHRTLLKKKTGYNVLFLTSAISETIEQFNNDLIGKFAEFSDFTFIDPRTNPEDYKNAKNSFVFMSRQLSSKKIKTGVTVVDQGEEDDIAFPIADIVKLLEDKLKKLPTFDICFFDEAHIGISATNVRANFTKAFKEFKMPIILMSATYSKPALALEDNKDLFVWDLQDIKDMKELPVIGFDGFVAKNPDVIARYPTIATKILNFRRKLGETETQIAMPYINFPSPNFISLTFTPDTIQKFTDTGNGYEFKKAFGFNSGSLDLLNHEKYADWGKLLLNREEAIRIRQFLTPEEEIETTPFLTGVDRKYRAFNQIFKISQQTGSRPIAGQPFSVLMFLPKGAGAIGKLCRVWASFLYESKYWRDNFVFLTLSAYVDKNYKSYPKITPELAVKRGICHREDFKTPLKQTIIDIEREALKNGKGLVLLSGDVGKMGISLKCVDVVCLMTDTKDADDIIQKMYRALTDDPPSKKNGFIIDLNIKRIITAMFDYAIEKARRNPESTSVDTTARMNNLFELCNWGQDAFIEDETAKGRTLDMIKKEIDIRILNDLIARTHKSNTKTVADKQVAIIFEDPLLKQEVYRVLKNTKADKSARPETISEKHTDIPDDLVSNAAASSEPKLKSETELEEVNLREIQLTDEQIKSKMSDILLTFINTLVIRSSNSWGTKFSELIQKFEADKPPQGKTPICDCSLKTECKVPHTNLYDIVYCEMRPYAYTPSKQYSTAIHEGIMNLIRKMFQQSSRLAPDWQIYIDGLTRDLVPKKGGRRKSWKKHPSRSNGRKTHRNSA